MRDEFANYGEGLALGDPAPDMTLRNEDGEETTLSAYWRAGPTALVFIRHFG
jgi:peroxiredoxin